MRRSGKLGALHQIVDLRQEITMAYNALAASDALIAEKPDLVRRMVRAILKGVRHVKASRGDTIATLLRHGLNDGEAIGLEYDIIAPSLTDNGTMPQDAQALDLALRADMLGLAKDRVPPPATVFDFRFANAASTSLDQAGWQPKR